MYTNHHVTNNKGETRLLRYYKSVERGFFELVYIFLDVYIHNYIQTNLGTLRRLNGLTYYIKHTCL